MTLDQILQEITSKLTGRPQDDAMYLLEQSEKYKSHEYHKEIFRMLERLAYELDPNGTSNAFTKIIYENNLVAEMIIEEVGFQIYMKNFERALYLMKPLVEDADKKCENIDNKVNEYHYFNNEIEEILYVELFKPAKELEQMPEDFAYIYYKYGAVLYELEKYDEAKAAFKKANKINPVKVQILFALAEISEMDENWDEYLDITSRCLKYSYLREDIARCYRNYGFYFSEHGNYEIAAALLLLSMHYDQESNVDVLDELSYISDEIGRNIEPLSPKETLKILKKNNIQAGPSALVLSIILSIAGHAQENKDEEKAEYFNAIFDNLGNPMGNEFLEEMIKSMKKKIKKK